MILSIKENFTPEEWKLLRKAPLVVSYAVMGSAPSNKRDLANEMKAVADAIVYTSEKASPDSLISAIANEIRADARDDSVGATETVSAQAMKERAIQTCQQIAPILQTKTESGEAESYKRWLLVIGQEVAEASKEGGILGFGGTQVSDSEKATLSEVATALGVTL